MSSGVKTVFSGAQGLRCPICIDVYTAPKNLPCLHTYCQHCLHKYIVKNVHKGKKGTTFSCPECRKETLPPLPDIPVDKWAEHYPYNSVLLSLLPPEKRTVDKNCDSCLYEGNSVRATSYCTVCKEALCSTCEKVHKKNKVSRDHTAVNIQDLFTDPELDVNLSVSVTCPEHVGKEFEFYCKSHSSMCCSECFYNSHRGCREVFKLKDHSERLLKEKEANTVVDRLKQLRSHLDQFKNENEGSLEKIEAEVNNMSDEIEVLRNKINTLLDNVKAKITMEKNALLKEESLVRHEENQQCESISSAITNSLHLLETVLAHGSPLHVLTTLHKIGEHLIYYESAVKEKYCEVRQVDTKLCLDDRLFSLIKCSETIIAKIDIVEKKRCLQSSYLPLNTEKTVKTTGVRHDASQARKKIVEGYKKTHKCLTLKSLKDCKPEQVAQFNAEYPDGKYPSYAGITCVSYDRIVLVDFYNNICRLYDPSHQHVADYELISRPQGVCVIDGPQIPYKRQIQLLTVDSSIQPGRTINTNMSCDGIAALFRDQLVVSASRKGVLYWCILSMDGSEESSLEVGSTKYCSSLAVNNSRTRIYVTCYTESAAVYAYSLDGTLIFKYEHQTLDGACGVAADREDNLYVVGQHSKNIHQVSPSGALLQVFFTGILESLYALSFTSSGDEFLLTGYRKLVQKFKLRY